MFDAKCCDQCPMPPDFPDEAKAGSLKSGAMVDISKVDEETYNQFIRFCFDMSVHYLTNHVECVEHKIEDREQAYEAARSALAVITGLAQYVSLVAGMSVEDVLETCRRMVAGVYDQFDFDQLKKKVAEVFGDGAIVLSGDDIIESLKRSASAGNN